MIPRTAVSTVLLFLFSSTLIAQDSSEPTTPPFGIFFQVSGAADVRVNSAVADFGAASNFTFGVLATNYVFGVNARARRRTVNGGSTLLKLEPTGVVTGAFDAVDTTAYSLEGGVFLEFGTQIQEWSLAHIRPEYEPGLNVFARFDFNIGFVPSLRSFDLDSLGVSTRRARVFDVFAGGGIDARLDKLSVRFLAGYARNGALDQGLDTTADRGRLIAQAFSPSFLGTGRAVFTLQYDHAFSGNTEEQIQTTLGAVPGMVIEVPQDFKDQLTMEFAVAWLIR